MSSYNYIVSKKKKKSEKKLKTFVFRLRNTVEKAFLVNHAINEKIPVNQFDPIFLLT